MRKATTMTATTVKSHPETYSAPAGTFELKLKKGGKKVPIVFALWSFS